MPQLLRFANELIGSVERTSGKSLSRPHPSGPFSLTQKPPLPIRSFSSASEGGPLVLVGEKRKIGSPFTVDSKPSPGGFKVSAKALSSTLQGNRLSAVWGLGASMTTTWASIEGEWKPGRGTLSLTWSLDFFRVKGLTSGLLLSGSPSLPLGRGDALYASFGLKGEKIGGQVELSPLGIGLGTVFTGVPLPYLKMQVSHTGKNFEDTLSTSAPFWTRRPLGEKEKNPPSATELLKMEPQGTQPKGQEPNPELEAAYREFDRKQMEKIREAFENRG